MPPRSRKNAKNDAVADKKKRKREDDDDSSDEEKPTKTTKKTKTKSNAEGTSVTDFDPTCEKLSSDGKSWNHKISSWNVNGIRAWIQKNGLDFLKKEDPDIFCLMETKCTKEKLPSECEVDGYTNYWLSGDTDGYSGVGLYTKQEPQEITYGIGMEEHDKEGRVITAEYDNFYLVLTYVPNAGRKLVRLDYRKQWDIDFRNYLKDLDSKKPVILCGDLNVAHEEIDLANPKTNKRNAGFTQEERDAFTELLNSGFVDSYRHLYPDQTKAYTFWTYMMNARAKDVGWRLDYFLLSEKLKPNLCDSTIRKNVLGSDHCPVTLFMAF